MHGPRRAPAGPSLLPLAPIPARGPLGLCGHLGPRLRGSGCWTGAQAGTPGGAVGVLRPALRRSLDQWGRGDGRASGSRQVARAELREAQPEPCVVGGCCQLVPLCVRLAPCWYLFERALGYVGLSEPVLVSTRLSVILFEWTQCLSVSSVRVSVSLRVCVCVCVYLVVATVAQSWTVQEFPQVQVLGASRRSGLWEPKQEQCGRWRWWRW